MHFRHLPALLLALPVFYFAWVGVKLSYFNSPATSQPYSFQRGEVHIIGHDPEGNFQVGAQVYQGHGYTITYPAGLHIIPTAFQSQDVDFVNDDNTCEMSIWVTTTKEGLPKLPKPNLQIRFTKRVTLSGDPQCSYYESDGTDGYQLAPLTSSRYTYEWYVYKGLAHNYVIFTQYPSNDAALFSSTLSDAISSFTCPGD